MPSSKFVIITVSVISMSLFLPGCSHYKSSWDCKNPKSFGCTSIEYADELARRHIILNAEGSGDKKTILLNEHYSDFKKYTTQEVEID